MNPHFLSKTQLQLFLLFSSHQVGQPLQMGNNMVSQSLQISINLLGEIFQKISVDYDTLHIPESWRGSLHIFLLLIFILNAMILRGGGGVGGYLTNIWV